MVVLAGLAQGEVVVLAVLARATLMGDRGGFLVVEGVLLGLIMDQTIMLVPGVLAQGEAGPMALLALPSKAVRVVRDLFF
jgi:hypothetical protein